MLLKRLHCCVFNCFCTFLQVTKLWCQISSRTTRTSSSRHRIRRWSAANTAIWEVRCKAWWSSICQCHLIRWMLHSLHHHRAVHYNTLVIIELSHDEQFNFCQWNVLMRTYSKDIFCVRCLCLKEPRLCRSRRISSPSSAMRPCLRPAFRSTTASYLLTNRTPSGTDVLNWFSYTDSCIYLQNERDYLFVFHKHWCIQISSRNYRLGLYD